MSLDGIVQGVAAFWRVPNKHEATRLLLRSARNTPIGLWKRKTVRVSSPALSWEGRHARTPPSAFPFLRITMSKSRWACGWVPHSRTFDGSKSSIKSQRQPQRSREKLGACSASVSVDRAVASNPAGCANSPREGCDLRIDSGLVKAGQSFNGRFPIPAWAWQRGHIPARMSRHSSI
jgi:hypothetical protein